MTLDEAKKQYDSGNRLVRIAPQAERKRDGRRHWSRGKLLAVGRRLVTVQPFGRTNGPIECEPEHVHAWHAREPLNADASSPAAGDAAPHNPEEQPVIPNAQNVNRIDVGGLPVRHPLTEKPAATPVVATRAAAPLSDVLAQITSLVPLVRVDEENVAAAERRHQQAIDAVAAATAAAGAAADDVLRAMEQVEIRKSELRRLRGQLDEALGGAA